MSSASSSFSAAFCVLAVSCVSCWDQVLAKMVAAPALDFSDFPQSFKATVRITVQFFLLCPLQFIVQSNFLI